MEASRAEARERSSVAGWRSSLNPEHLRSGAGRHRKRLARCPRSGTVSAGPGNGGATRFRPPARSRPEAAVARAGRAVGGPEPDPDDRAAATGLPSGREPPIELPRGCSQVPGPDCFSVRARNFVSVRCQAVLISRTAHGRFVANPSPAAPRLNGEHPMESPSFAVVLRVRRAEDPLPAEAGGLKPPRDLEAFLDDRRVLHLTALARGGV